ncbi:MAG: glucosylceramidase, partial [Fibrobacter sp.]|nr:glucosylceramidase [Fibrobacter sp.]
FNFQAHDVWICIQYSIASGLILHKNFDEARDLVESMVQNLYEEAKIPFAAPEGFNGSCRLHEDTLEKAGVSASAAKTLIAELVKKKALLPDQRIAPTLTTNLSSFKKSYGALAKKAKISEEDLFTLLHSTALKYTAGKYFRPGMVFALFEALNK